MTEPSTFADRLKTLREQAGLSPTELARRAGIHRTHVYNLERKGDQPTLETLRKLAVALEVSVGHLLGES